MFEALSRPYAIERTTCLLASQLAGLASFEAARKNHCRRCKFRAADSVVSRFSSAIVLKALSLCLSHWPLDTPRPPCSTTLELRQPRLTGSFSIPPT